jgi:hypothetical protein
MSSEQDPSRLSELGDGSPELRQLFRSAREDVPSATKLEGLWARLEPLAGPTSGTSPVPPAAPTPPVVTSASSAGAGKLLAIVAAVGAAGVVAYFLSRPTPVAPSEPQKPTPAVAPVLTATPAPSTLQVPAPAVAPESTPSNTVAPAPAEARGIQSPASSKGASNDASAEAALLERAREAISSDPKRALALTREHARRFPKGILTQEREVIAIDALNRLGKSSEADSRADQFKKTYPGSPHQHGLDSATNQR